MKTWCFYFIIFLTLNSFAAERIECVTYDACQHEQTLGYCLDVIELRDDYDESYMIVTEQNTGFQEILLMQQRFHCK